MDNSGFILESSERTFRRKASGGSVVVWVFGGLLAVAAAVAGFVAASFTRHDQITLHLTTTMPVLLAVGAFTGAWATRTTPEEVGVGPGGLRITHRHGSQTYSWDQIGWCNIEVAPMSNRRLLRVYNAEGGTLTRLCDAIDGFDALFELVSGYVATKADGTADRIQNTKARKSAVFMGVGGLAFLALSGAVAWITQQEIHADQLLKTAAVPGQGQIVRRFVAPNGVTRRLVYQVTTPEGRSGERNAEMEKAAWEALANATTVPVRYVPGKPEISELVSGEVKRKDAFKQPLIGYGVPAVVALMSLAFLAAAVLQWRGLDIDLDSKTGKLSIKKFGTGR